jgi:hypothetical protein
MLSRPDFSCESAFVLVNHVSDINVDEVECLSRPEKAASICESFVFEEQTISKTFIEHEINLGARALVMLSYQGLKLTGGRTSFLMRFIMSSNLSTAS